MSHLLRFFRIAFFGPVLLTSSVIGAAETKPVFLYSRCFNAPGETRYLPDGNYKFCSSVSARTFRCG